MKVEDGAKTRHDAVYRRLRDDILHGRIEPGSKLPFAGLREQYGASVGSLREALSRLVEQGLVRSAPQQGFFVTPLSRADLVQLTDARVELESLTLRKAVEHGDVAWESEVIAAHHRLVASGQEGGDDWEEAHAEFHEALLAGCGNGWLLDIAVRLRASAELYRRRSFPLAQRERRDIAGEHRAIVDAVLERDADEAARLLAEHVSATSALLLDAGFPDDPADVDGREPPADAQR